MRQKCVCVPSHIFPWSVRLYTVDTDVTVGVRAGADSDTRYGTSTVRTRVHCTYTLDRVPVMVPVKPYGPPPQTACRYSTRE